MASRLVLATAATLVLACLAFSVPLAEGPKALALVEQASGELRLTRAGKDQPAPGPGDLVFDGDMIRTSANGRAILSIDKSSGFSGTLTVNPSTTVYIRADMIKGQPRTALELMLGSVSTKVGKIAGTPSMVVTTGESAFAVRGTEFEIAISINDSILAICLEGMIAVAADKTEKNLGPGLAIDRKAGSTFARLDVPVASLRTYRDTWIAEEIGAFRSNPFKALTSYEQRYSDNLKQLLADAKSLTAHPVIKRWIAELRAGTMINPLDAQVLRDKKDISPLIVSLAKRLSVFERIYYRLDEVAALMPGSGFERAEIRRGLTVDKFLATVAANYDAVGAAILDFRQAEALYRLHNPDSAGIEGIGQGGDFFSSGDGFFDQSNP